MDKNLKKNYRWYEKWWTWIVIGSLSGFFIIYLSFIYLSDAKNLPVKSSLVDYLGARVENFEVVTEDGLGQLDEESTKVMKDEFTDINFQETSNKEENFSDFSNPSLNLESEFKLEPESKPKSESPDESEFEPGKQVFIKPNNQDFRIPIQPLKEE